MRSILFALLLATVLQAAAQLTPIDPRNLDARVTGIEAWPTNDWSTAFGWGDHGAAGYLLGEDIYFRLVDGTVADLVDAVETAVEGQTIYVPAGTYELAANLVHDTEADIVVLGAQGGARAVLAGAYSFTIGASCTIEGLDVTGLAPANFQFTFTDNATPTGTLRYCDAGDYAYSYWIGKTNNFDIEGSTFGNSFCEGGTNNGAISNSTFGHYFCADSGTNNGAISNSTFGQLFCEGGTNNGDISNSTFKSNFCDYGGTNNGTVRDSTFADTASSLIDRLGTDGEYIDCVDGTGVMFSTPDVLFGGEVDATVLKQDGTALDSLLGGKADIVATPTDGNFAGLDASGNLTDSGSTAADFEPADATILKAADVGTMAYEATTDYSTTAAANALYVPTITDMTLNSNKVWQASVDGDLLRVAVQGDYELDIQDPAATNTPIRVSTQLIQQGTNAWSVVLTGNLETQGGVALTDIQSTSEDAVDLLKWQWDGTAWVLMRTVFDHE